VHHLGVDAVTVLSRVVDDPRERDDLVILELHALRKRRELARLHVIGDAFPVLKRAVFHPQLACLLCDAAIGVEITNRHRYDEPINVMRHMSLLWVVNLSSSSRAHPGSAQKTIVASLGSPPIHSHKRSTGDSTCGAERRHGNPIFEALSSEASIWQQPKQAAAASTSVAQSNV